MTTTNQDSPAEVLERFESAQPKLQIFYEMAVNYFRCKCLDKKNLERRPPVALCLRDPDHVFTIKPGFRSPRKRLVDGILTIVEYGQMDFDTIYIDCVSVTEMPSQSGRPILQHNHACKLRINKAGELTCSGNWYFQYAPIAVHGFVDIVKEFVLFPWLILGRSKDNCCCCGKPLMDETSRSRGVGPECLRNAALCFGQPPK